MAKSERGGRRVSMQVPVKLSWVSWVEKRCRDFEGLGEWGVCGHVKGRGRSASS